MPKSTTPTVGMILCVANRLQNHSGEIPFLLFRNGIAVPRETAVEIRQQARPLGLLGAASAGRLVPAPSWTEPKRVKPWQGLTFNPEGSGQPHGSDDLPHAAIVGERTTQSDPVADMWVRHQCAKGRFGSQVYLSASALIEEQLRQPLGPAVRYHLLKDAHGAQRILQEGERLGEGDGAAWPCVLWALDPRPFRVVVDSPKRRNTLGTCTPTPCASMLDALNAAALTSLLKADLPPTLICTELLDEGPLSSRWGVTSTSTSGACTRSAIFPQGESADHPVRSGAHIFTDGWSPIGWRRYQSRAWSEGAVGSLRGAQGHPAGCGRFLSFTSPTTEAPPGFTSGRLRRPSLRPRVSTWIFECICGSGVEPAFRGPLRVPGSGLRPSPSGRRLSPALGYAKSRQIE